MKMKEVCSATGLTDRTIRYYIEEDLITPEIKRNYSGRKSIDFSERDVADLKDISILRKAGFSIADIKSIQEIPSNSIQIIEKLKDSINQNIQEQSETLKVLNALDKDTDYSVHTLAACLAEANTDRQNPENRKFEKAKEIVLALPKAILCLIVIIVPILLVVASFRQYLYPDFKIRSAICLLLTILPAVAGIKVWFSKNNHYGILITCLCFLPIAFLCSLFAFDSSTTTNITYYLEMEGRVRESEIFPRWAKTSAYFEDENGELKSMDTGAKYYYHYTYGFDDSYDIYAEWTLPKNEFADEIGRQREIFKARQENSVLNNGNRLVTVIDHGNYHCLCSYSGNKRNSMPFDEQTDNYSCSIFAYDEEKCRVRYIDSYSLQNGTYEPYYIQLDW